MQKSPVPFQTLLYALYERGLNVVIVGIPAGENEIPNPECLKMTPETAFMCGSRKPFYILQY